MKLNLNPKTNPDLLGETLRDEFFKQELKHTRYGDYRQLGCYDTFELKDDVTPLPDELLDEEYPEDGSYHVFKKMVDGQEIIMKYFWDGDGELEFFFKGGMISNDDCKKTYGWTFYDEKPIDWQ
jgi:hypothetical protein